MLGVPRWWPTGKRIGVVIAHDTSENMDQHEVACLHAGLAERGYLTIRFNFPFAQERKKRADAAPLLEKAYRGAIAALMRDPQEAPARLILTGFGLGGRIASHAVAGGIKADGLVFLSYPLHPAGKPAKLRTGFLFRIICPMLFVQGDRDVTCRVDRLEPVLRRIGAPTLMHVVKDADHGFGVVKRSERTQEEIDAEVVDRVDAFVRRVIGTA